MYKSLVKIAEDFFRGLIEISFFGFVYSFHVLNAFAEMQMLVERRWTNNERIKRI